MDLKSLHEIKRDIAAQTEEHNVPEVDVARVTHHDVDAGGQEHEDQEYIFTQGRRVRDDGQQRHQRNANECDPDETAGARFHVRAPSRPLGRMSKIKMKMTYSMTGTQPNGIDPMICSFM